jgi:hypothetical protein
MQKVTIIWECNCYVGKPRLLDRVRLATGLAQSVNSGSMASVWVVFGDYDQDRDDQDFRTMGTRIIGPVLPEQADAVIAQLRAAFTMGGFQVTTAATADD